MKFGTNCGNCSFFGRPWGVAVNINSRGGIIMNGERLERAKANDLVTLPTFDAPGEPHVCTNPKLNQPVNDRMCCALWDNLDARREWERNQ